MNMYRCADVYSEIDRLDEYRDRTGRVWCSECETWHQKKKRRKNERRGYNNSSANGQSKPVRIAGDEEVTGLMTDTPVGVENNTVDTTDTGDIPDDEMDNDTPADSESYLDLWGMHIRRTELVNLTMLTVTGVLAVIALDVLLKGIASIIRASKLPNGIGMTERK
jgi:hypothetical protein